MAETLLDALVKLSFEGEDAVGKAADVVRQIEATLRNFGANVPGVDLNIGGDLTGKLSTLQDIERAFGLAAANAERLEVALRGDTNSPMSGAAANSVRQIVDALRLQELAVQRVQGAQTQANEAAISQSRAVEARIQAQISLMQEMAAEGRLRPEQMAQVESDIRSGGSFDDSYRQRVGEPPPILPVPVPEAAPAKEETKAPPLEAMEAVAKLSESTGGEKAKSEPPPVEGIAAIRELAEKVEKASGGGVVPIFDDGSGMPPGGRPPTGGGGAVGEPGDPQSNFDRLYQAMAGAEPGVSDPLMAAKTRQSLAADEQQKAKDTLNRLDPKDEEYEAAEKRAANAIGRLLVANAALERELDNRAKAEASAAEAARRTADAQGAYQGRHRTPDSALINPDDNEFMHSMGVNPDAPMAERNKQVQQALTQLTLAENEAVRSRGGDQADIGRLTAQRLRLTNILANAEETEKGLVDKRLEAERQRTLAAQDPRLARLSLPPDEYLKARDVDAEQPLTQQGIDLKRQQNELKRKDIAAEAERIAAGVEDGATLRRVAELDDQLAALTNQEIALRKQEIALAARERRTANGAGGFLGGLLSQDPETGSMGGNFLGQAGVTLKYFALYSAFSAVETGMREVMRQAEELSLRINQLSIAMGTGTDQAAQAAKEYVAIGSQYAVDPQFTIEAATKVGRSFAAPDGSFDMAAGRSGARLGSVIGTLDKKDEQAATLQDTIAIAKSFNVTATGLQGIYDQMLAVAQKFGYQTVGEVAPGVAQISDIGRESGFSIPALTALVTGVMQRTGQTSDGAAGDLKRVLGSENSAAWTGLYARYNVDMSHTGDQRLTDLAKAMEGVPREERTRELSSLGGPRVAAAIQAIFDDRTQSADAVKAANNSQDLGEEQARKKLEALGGAVDKTGAELQGLFLALVNSGLGDALKFIVDRATDLVTVLRTVIDAWGTFPTAAKDTVAALALLTAAAKIQAMVGGPVPALGTQLRGIFGAGTAEAGALQTPGVVKGLGMAVGTSEAEMGATLAAAAPAEAATGMEALASGLIGVTAAIGPLVIALAAVAGVAYLINQQAQKDNASSQAGDANKAASDALASGDQQQYQDALTAEQAAKKAMDDAGISGTPEQDHPVLASKYNPPGWHQGSGMPGDTQRQAAKPVDPNSPEARYRKAQANIKTIQDRIAEHAALLKEDSSLDGENLFGQDYSDLSSGISILTQKGMGADKSTSLLGTMFSKGGDVVNKLLHPLSGQKGASDWLKQITDQISAVQDPTQQTAQFGNVKDVLAGAKTEVEKTGQADDIASITLLYNQSVKQWTQALLTSTKMRIDAINSDYTGPASGNAIKAALTDALNQMTKAGAITETIQLMNGANKQFLDAYIAGLEAEKKALDDQRAAIAEAAAEATRIVGSSPDIRAEQRGQQKAAVAVPSDVAINKQINTAKTAAASAAPGGQDFAQQNALDVAQINEAIIPGNQESAAQQAVKAAQSKLNALGGKHDASYWDALKALNDAKYQLAVYENNKAIAQEAATVQAGNPLAAAAESIKGTQAKLKAAVDPTEIANLQRQLADQQRSYADMQLGAAEAEENSKVLPNDPLAAAKNAIAQATARVNFYKGVDSTKYYDALKSLRQSQYDAAKIELDLANNQALLHIDITDPVAVAKQRVKQASDQLAFDRRRGAGADVVTADEVALRQNQSDAQGQQWQQNFSDMRTNYDLYRTGLSTYMSYLRSQHDYLSAVKVRTRQQTEELNQVDEAIKGLTESMNGQWNLGDIKVPTAYDMRRSLAGGGMTPNVSYVTITMTGSSTAEMKAAIQGAIGQTILQTVGTAPAKV